MSPVPAPPASLLHTLRELQKFGGFGGFGVPPQFHRNRRETLCRIEAENPSEREVLPSETVPLQDVFVGYIRKRFFFFFLSDLQQAVFTVKGGAAISFQVILRTRSFGWFGQKLESLYINTPHS